MRGGIPRPHDRGAKNREENAAVVRLKAETARGSGMAEPALRRGVGLGGERRDNPSFSSRQSFITATTQTHSQPL